MLGTAQNLSVSSAVLFKFGIRSGNSLENLMKNSCYYKYENGWKLEVTGGEEKKIKGNPTNYYRNLWVR